MENCGNKCYSAGIYARLSVDNRDRKAESVEAQIELAKEFINCRPDIRLYGCYRDRGKTGTNFMRSGFGHLMEDVRKGLVDCIIVKDFSRLGRNYIETGNYLETIFPFLGVRFISVTDGYDSLRAEDSDALGVELKQLVNELYAKDIGLKVKASRQVKWERGEYVGGNAPYGYQGGQKDGRKTLRIDAEAAGVVRELFERYARGESQKGLIGWLYERGVHRPGDYRKTGHVFCQEGETLCQWDRGTVKNILQNPVYLGRLVRFKKEAEEEAGERGGMQIKENTHEAVVSKELFDRVAERFEHQTVCCNRKGFSRQKPEDANPFKGLLVCGECQKGMARAASVRLLGSGVRGRVYTYYCRNSGRIDGLGCGKKRISPETVEILLREGLCRELSLAGICPDRLLLAGEECLRGEWAALAKRREQIERQAEGGKRRASEKYLQYRQGRLSREEFLSWKQKEEVREAELEQSLLEYDRKIKEAERQWGNKKKHLRRLFRFEEGVQPEAKFFEALIQKIVVYPQKCVEIVYHFPAAWEPDLSERRDKGRMQ